MSGSKSKRPRSTAKKRRAEESPAKGASDAFVGEVIDDRFTLHKLIGRGGMGLVYRATQAPLDREVAIKLLVDHPDPSRVEEHRQRFTLEASTAARLNHPNTITIFDYGQVILNGEITFFIAMELLPGKTLTQMLKGSHFTPARAVHVSLQICRALREAHRAGVVHRDLKPGNIMLQRPHDDAGETEPDFVKVLDFGLVKTFAGGEALTKAGTFLGSPRYVSPEQVEGRPIDARSDIYSFGVVLYRMLSGRVPFDGSVPIDIMLKHLDDEPPLLDVDDLPNGLEALVMQCLQKNPAHRPDDMNAVIGTLKQCQELLAPSALPAEQHPNIDAEGGQQEISATGPTLADRRTTPLRQVVDPDAHTVRRLASPGSSTRDGGLHQSNTPQRFSLEDDPTGNEATVLQAPTRHRPPLLAGGVIGGLLAGALIVAHLTGTLDPLLGKPPPPPLRNVEVRVRSVPSHARVFPLTPAGKRGALLGSTPLTFHRSLKSNDPAFKLLLKKRGYRNGTVTVAPPGAQAKQPFVVQVKTKLRRRGKGRP